VVISTSMPANINRFISSPDFGLWGGPDPLAALWRRCADTSRAGYGKQSPAGSQR
jgi:hypothetical protein